MDKDNSRDPAQSINTKCDRPIALIGMMGAGKSHVGRALGKVLERDFYDSDHVIEGKAQLSIPEIFERFGEDKFRDVENKTIVELLEQGPCVIATGGGAVMNPQTLQALKDKAVLIWLDADVDSLLDRVQRNSNRPLLQNDDPRATLSQLLEARRNLYAQAHVRFDTSAEKAQKSDDLILQDMLQAIDEYLSTGNS